MSRLGGWLSRNTRVLTAAALCRVFSFLFSFKYRIFVQTPPKKKNEQRRRLREVVLLPHVTEKKIVFTLPQTSHGNETFPLPPAFCTLTPCWNKHQTDQGSKSRRKKKKNRGGLAPPPPPQKKELLLKHLNIRDQPDALLHFSCPGLVMLLWFFFPLNSGRCGAGGMRSGASVRGRVWRGTWEQSLQMADAEQESKLWNAARHRWDSASFLLRCRQRAAVHLTWRTLKYRGLTFLRRSHLDPLTGGGVGRNRRGLFALLIAGIFNIKMAESEKRKRNLHSLSFFSDLPNVHLQQDEKWVKSSIFSLLWFPTSDCVHRGLFSLGMEPSFF